MARNGTMPELHVTMTTPLTLDTKGIYTGKNSVEGKEDQVPDSMSGETPGILQR